MNRKTYVKLSCVFSICFMLCAFSLAGCGKRTEAVITTGGDEFGTNAVTHEPLSESKAKVFTYDDLRTGSLTYLMTEKQVRTVLGNPTSVKNAGDANVSLENGDSILDEKFLIYNQMTLIFSKKADDYYLTGVKTTGTEKFSRGLQVGNTLDDILNAYYRDTNCMDNYYLSQDKTTVMGRYLYGTYTMDVIDTVQIQNEIAYGIIDLGGADSIENATNSFVQLTYFDQSYKNGSASAFDDFAQIMFTLDSNKKITAIQWYYYPEI